jgi:acyl-CoA thioesterase-2
MRADEWHLYDLHALSNSNARGLVRGVMHGRDGTLRASVVQEALVRPVGRDRPPPHWASGPELRAQ